MIVLDMDSFVSPTHGDQQGTAYNGHFGCTCYHPLFVFNQFGDLERCGLRPGNVHSAHEWRDVLEPVVARYPNRTLRRYFRGDAAFASPEVYEFLEACQKGLSVGFLTAAALVHELMEARDEKRLLRLQKQLAKYHLLIIDELGFVPLPKTGAELLFEVFSQRYERGSILVTSNLPFDEWTEIFGSERLTGALLDRLTHHVHILEMNGESYRLNQSQKRRKSPKIPA